MIAQSLMRCTRERSFMPVERRVERACTCTVYEGLVTGVFGVGAGVGMGVALGFGFGCGFGCGLGVGGIAGCGFGLTIISRNPGSMPSEGS